MIVGLTGSIGMGKSTTAEMFREFGIPVHDSDSAVHELYAASAVAPISAAFPGVVEDDVINRAALGQRVFADDRALKRLEEIVHPLVSHHRDVFLSHAREKGYMLCVVDVPLLFETGANLGVDLSLVITASSSVQKERVMARPGMTTARFHAILSRQMPDSEKRRKAHWIIDTSFGLDAARRQVSGLLRAVSR